MTNTTANFLTWFPRVLAMVFAVFISIFALDVLEAHDPFFSKTAHFFIHLIPSFAVLAVLWLAWYQRIFGGLMFMILGMVFTIHFGTWREMTLFLMFSLPLFVAGVAFIFSRYSQLQPQH